jgi:hypothetical protein
MWKNGQAYLIISVVISHLQASNSCPVWRGSSPPLDGSKGVVSFDLGTRGRDSTLRPLGLVRRSALGLWVRGLLALGATPASQKNMAQIRRPLKSTQHTFELFLARCVRKMQQSNKRGLYIYHLGVGMGCRCILKYFIEDSKKLTSPLKIFFKCAIQSIN